MEINSLMEPGQATILNTGSTIAREQSSFQQTLEKMQRMQNTHKQEPQTGAKNELQGAAVEEDAALKKACQEIEAIFIQQMLKQMRATVPKSNLIPESMATNLYREMLDSEYSKLMAESSQSLGIAELLYEQLKPR